MEAHYHPQTKAVYPRYGHGLICYYTVFISLFLAALAKKLTVLVLRCGIHKAEHGDGLPSSVISHRDYIPKLRHETLAEKELRCGLRFIPGGGQRSRTSRKASGSPSGDGDFAYVESRITHSCKEANSSRMILMSDRMLVT